VQQHAREGQQQQEDQVTGHGEPSACAPMWGWSWQPSACPGSSGQRRARRCRVLSVRRACSTSATLRAGESPAEGAPAPPTERSCILIERLFCRTTARGRSSTVGGHRAGSVDGAGGGRGSRGRGAGGARPFRRPVLLPVRRPDAAGRLVPRLPQLRHHQRLLLVDATPTCGRDPCWKRVSAATSRSVGKFDRRLANVLNIEK
jgi:hypothetical protein